MHIDKSVHNNILTVGGRRYANGIGIHADSSIKCKLPKGAKTLDIKAGVDDEVESASMQFFILADGEELWRSEKLYGSEGAVGASIDVQGMAYLELTVNGLGNNSNDHTDWLNPVLTLDENMTQRRR